MNTVAFNEGHTVQLEDKLFLGDAISDMPEVRDKFQDTVKLLLSLVYYF